MRACAVFLLACAMSSGALAQLPSPDPAGQYRLIGPAERSDSRCIGKPETPLCAVETLLACFARLEATLCWQVWHPPGAGGALFGRNPPPPYWWSYRIAAAEQISPDEAEIAIAGRHCGLQMTTPDCYATPAPPTRYRVRRMGNAWQVVDWASPPGSP